MKKCNLVLSVFLAAQALQPLAVSARTEDQGCLPDLRAELQQEYSLYEPLSDEFNGSVNEMWLMDYMPWWSDTATREKSGTRTRYRFINAEEGNQSLQIWVNGENHMDAENFQPYYLEKLSGPRNQSIQDRYLWSQSSQKNNWNSKFAGFMGGSKDYLNTYRGSEAPIENHVAYSDAGATTYGYFETRCKFMSMEKGQGLAPAFWFIGMQDEAYDRGEVDVFEFLDNYTLDFTIHPKGDDRITYATKEIKFTEDMSRDYHTYGLLWDETGFSLYVDGEFIWKHEISINYRMIPMFSINHHENGWIGSVDDKNLPDERTFDIDYFRVFKKNGQDPDLGTPAIPEIKEGTNAASAAWVSLFGLTGTEANATPMQNLNDGDLSTSVLSGKKDRLGNSITASELPVSLYIDWKKPQSFNTIILHCQNAASMAPTLVDVEVCEDGQNWIPVKQDISLDWKTDSQIAESQTIHLDQMVENNSQCRLVIRKANLKQGQFGISEVEIGQNITAMQPEYQPLPEAESVPLSDSLFASWNLNGSLEANQEGLRIDNSAASSTAYQISQDGHEQALRLDGFSTRLYVPLKNVAGDQHLRSDENFTFSMWIKPDAVVKGSDQIILAQQTGSKGGRPFLFIYDNKLGTYLGVENTYSSQNLTKEIWTQTAVTFEKTDEAAKKGIVTLYINGKKTGSKVITYEDDSLSDPRLLLASHKSGTKGEYKGLMDDITLFDKALTEKEMMAFYEQGADMDVYSDAGRQYEMTSIVDLPVVQGTAGEMKAEDLQLPDSVTCIFDGQYSAEVPVTWDEEELAAIDYDQARETVLHGVPDLSALPQALNSDGLKAEIRLVLEEPLDASALEKTFDRINALDSSLYTSESMAAFLEACQNVQTKNTMLMIGQYPGYSAPEILPESCTQEVLDRMVSELEQAFGLLVKKEIQTVSLTLLDQALSYAEARMEDGSLENLNTIVADYLQQAVQEGKALKDKTDVSQEEVNHAWLKLCRAIQMLEFKSDKSLLNALIVQAEGLDLNLYEDGPAKEDFIESLELARETAQRDTALNASIEEAQTRLQTAMDHLVLKSEAVDCTLLSWMIAQAESLKAEDFVEQGWQQMLVVLEEARTVLADPESQDQVDQAAAALNSAVLDLRLKPSEELLRELNDFVETVQTLNLSLYSPVQRTALMNLSSKIQNGIAEGTLDQKQAEDLAAEVKKSRSILEHPALAAQEPSAEKPKSDSASQLNPASPQAEERETGFAERSVKPAVSRSVKTAAGGTLFWMTSALASLALIRKNRKRKH